MSVQGPALMPHRDVSINYIMKTDGGAKSFVLLDLYFCHSGELFSFIQIFITE
jgi:hypothetical protein